MRPVHRQALHQNHNTDLTGKISQARAIKRETCCVISFYLCDRYFAILKCVGVRGTAEGRVIIYTEY